MAEIDPKEYRHRRVGYAGSGFAFHFIRCQSKDVLRAYVKDVIKAPYQPWFDAANKTEAPPEAYSISIQTRVLPGTIPEAAGDFLCENWILVVAQDDRKTELRHWYHECGHICDMARYGFEPATQAASAARQWRSETADWYLGFTTRMAEFPGYCNELLCEAANAMVDGTEDAIESGFPFLMPWLGHGEEA